MSQISTGIKVEKHINDAISKGLIFGKRNKISSSFRSRMASYVLEVMHHRIDCLSSIFDKLAAMQNRAENNYLRWDAVNVLSLHQIPKSYPVSRVGCTH